MTNKWIEAILGGLVFGAVYCLLRAASPSRKQKTCWCGESLIVVGLPDFPGDRHSVTMHYECPVHGLEWTRKGVQDHNDTIGLVEERDAE